MRRGTSSKVAVALWLLLLVLAAVVALAQAPAPAAPAAATTAAPAAPVIPAAAVAGPGFDPRAATEAYLNSLGAEKRAKSDAYFEGGYWLTLWSFLYGLGVAGILLGSRLSAGMRDLAERITRVRALQTWLYAIQYMVVSFVLSFPLAVYTDYFREHQYGLSTQTFGAWLGEGLKALGIGLVLGGLALTLLYAVVRKAPRTWWIWGAIVSLLFAVAGIALGPVFIEPMFNNYTELQDSTLRGPILALARANGIPAQHVYVVDASKQSNRVSANVAGLFGTTRIALNDNLLHRGSVAEVKAVMGHEMGHYVLHHVSKSLLFVGVVLVVGFLFLRWGFAVATARWGDRWGLRGIADPAGLPLLAALFSIYGFVLTPVFNTQTRTMEAEADIFGLNAAREPDGMAQATLQLSEYRKLSPGPIEEYIFFDHPSGRNRILMAMRWKAEHLGDGPLGK
jgi:STE24 endopeptidase